MNESGPIKRPEKTLETSLEFSDLQRVATHAWRAEWGGRRWLLKTARGDNAASGVLLRREFELSCKLQHPFIASALMFLEESPVGPAIMTEYVEGGTLREFLASRPPKAVRRKIFSQLLDAVEYLHQKGLLHNDIKPENILVTAIGGDVKLIDFGFAEQDSDYLNKRLGGTPGATAPEVLRGDGGKASAASADIYSLGAILRLLFPGRYRRIIGKCRRADPSERYTDISSLRRAVARADRRPVPAAAVALATALVCVALIPDLVRERKVQREEDTVQAGVRQIRQDLSAFYRQAADSLSDSSLVPDRMAAYWVRNNFAERVAQYRKSLAGSDMQFTCDTVYARMVTSLSELLLDIPE